MVEKSICYAFLLDDCDCYPPYGSCLCKLQKFYEEEIGITVPKEILNDIRLDFFDLSKDYVGYTDYPTLGKEKDYFAALVEIPPPRQWIRRVQRNLKNFGEGTPIKVVSYNVLHKDYATIKKYSYCPNWALQWEVRKKWIIDDILYQDADVICLQEIATSEYFYFFRPFFFKRGYKSVFYAKSRANGLRLPFRLQVDGCATFYKEKTFIYRDKAYIELNKLDNLSDKKGPDELIDRYNSFDNIAVVVLLDIRGPDDTELPLDRNLIAIVNTHLHWNPTYCDTKLLQSMMLCKEIENIINAHMYEPELEIYRLDPKQMQVLLCGDFNSLPSSGVYEYLANGRVSMKHPDFKNMGENRLLKALLLNNGKEYLNPFKFASVYQKNDMPNTNYTLNFKGTIDYIFHTTTGIDTIQCLGPLSAEYMKRNMIVGLPQPHLPSDHFLIAADLRIYKTASNHPVGGRKKPYYVRHLFR